jgi:predicted permease
MAHWRRMIAKLRNLFANKRAEEDLAREVASHLALLADDFERRGLSPEEARLAARRAYGGVEQAKQAHRDERSILWMEQTVQDLRYGLRTLSKSPGFTMSAVLILALGIGASTAVFSILESVLLRPYAFQDPERIVIWREVIQEAVKEYPFVPDNYRHFVYLSSHAKTIQGAALVQDSSFAVTADSDHPRIEKGLNVSPNFFSVLGVNPVVGRAFLPEESQPGRNHVVVLSWSAWQDLFHGESDAVGRTIKIKGETVTVVGVLPREFEFPVINAMSSGASPDRIKPYELFQPFVAQEEDLTSDDGDFAFLVIARLKPGIVVGQASTELSSLLRAYSVSNHLPFHLSAIVEPLSEAVTGSVSKALWLLFVAVFGLLLIACVNVSSLQLARAVVRERDSAVRTALGAGRARIVQMAFTESMVLCISGGALGFLLALGGIRLFIGVAPENLPRLHEIHVTWSVLLFACGVSGLAALLSGTLPALRSIRFNSQRALASASTRIVRSGHTPLIRKLLIGFEIACTVALLIVTGLVVRSFSRVLNQPHDFDASHVILTEADLLSPGYEQPNGVGDSARSKVIDRILDEIRSTPGVESAAVTSAMPLSGETAVHSIYRPDHPLPESEVPTANLRNVSPGYFPTMRTRLIAGRDFDTNEFTNPQSAIISQRAAQVAWPEGRALGRKLKFDGRIYTVIAIAADARIADLKENIPVVYLPYWHDPPAVVFFLVRTSRTFDEFAPILRRDVWNADPGAAIPVIEMLDTQMAQAVAPERLQSIILSSFGVSALILAILGVYGVLAYAVSVRQQEFGIRIALGSSKSALIGLVMLQAAYPVVLGTGAGLVMAFILVRWARSLLYETSVIDPLAVGGSVMLLLVAATFAAIVPARRAASTDPMRVLRME